MNREIRDYPLQKKQILFIFPLVYRPEKVNVAKRFTLLSSSYYGHIFAMSGVKQRNVPLSDFFYHADKFPSNAVIRFFRGLWFQITVPLRMVWRKSRVDAVISYDPYRSGLAAMALKYVLRCKMIVEINGEFHTDYEKSESGKTYLKSVIIKLLPKLVLGSADAIKVLNSDQEAYFHQLLPAKAIYRFPDFVATDYFQSLATFQGDYFLSIGHPFHRKGVDVLIDAFMQVAEKYPQVKLKIMGYSPKDELQQYRAIAHDHPRIEFVEPGWIEDVGEQLRNCYALVSAARSEAMGRVFIEAMACGKPIVATRTNGGMLCIEDGQTGLLCAIDDAGSLAEKLDELLSDTDRANRMGDAGRLRMQKKFSEAAYIEDFDAMVKEVTEGTAAT